MPPSRGHAWLGLGSWALAVAILVALLCRADPDALWAALRSADLVRYGLASALFVGVWLAVDGFILSWLFGRLGAPIGWAEMLRLRGATYLLLAASLHAANAALVALVHRRAGIGLARAAASMGVLYAGDLTALCAFSWLASLGSTSPLVAALRPLLGLVSLGGVALLVCAVAFGDRLRGRPFFGVAADLGAGDVVLLVALRSAFYASFVLFFWLTLPALGIKIPVGEIATRVPLVMSVAALPITPGGLGTTQAAMLALFGELADPNRVLAYSLLYGFTLVVFRLPVGAALAPNVLARRIEEPCA